MVAGTVVDDLFDVVVLLGADSDSEVSFLGNSMVAGNDVDGLLDVIVLLVADLSAEGSFLGNSMVVGNGADDVDDGTGVDFTGIS